MSRALVVALALVLAPLAAGCPGRGGTGAARAQAAVLLVECDIPDALVVIDDVPAGQVRDARGGIRLRAGAHRLELRHDRYHTRYVELDLARGERRTVKVALVEVLD